MRSGHTRRFWLKAISAVPILGAALPATAGEPQILKVGELLADFHRLTPGVRTYLRSRQMGDRHVPIDLWRREIRFETIDGVPRLRIMQRWDAPASVSERDSVFELETFRPLTHLRTTTRDGVRTVEGFRFSPDGVGPLEGIADNSRVDFTAPSPEPMFNFEVDLETLQSLPLAAGYSASIPFYHPGGGPPARYVWTVAEEDRILAPDGRDIDCWIVQTDYNTPGRSPASFWFAKNTQQFIKLESEGPDGSTNRKSLLL